MPSITQSEFAGKSKSSIRWPPFCERWKFRCPDLAVITTSSTHSSRMRDRGAQGWYASDFIAVATIICFKDDPSRFKLGSEPAKFNNPTRIPRINGKGLLRYRPSRFISTVLRASLLSFHCSEPHRRSLPNQFKATKHHQARLTPP